MFSANASHDKLKFVGQLKGYEAVRSGGAGLIDLTQRGRIRVGGSEAVMFLNGLITNDMKTLLAKSWMPAVFPNVQGRLIASVRVLRLTDENEKNPIFILDTEPTTHQAVLKTIERFTLAGDFRVIDVTADTMMFSVQGRSAAAIVEQVLNVPAANLPANGLSETTFNGANLTLIRATHSSEDGFDLIIDAEHGAELLKAMIDAGAVLVGDETAEVLRIEAGIARFGQDMDESNVVSETNLDDAVSFTKGCYIGQEIIVRIKHRGHVAKKLTGLFIESDAVETGSVIKSTEGKEIGRITSATFSPQLNKAISLGYIRYEFLAPGTDVVVGEGAVPAKVTEVPFVSGSWTELSRDHHD